MSSSPPDGPGEPEDPDVSGGPGDSADAGEHAAGEHDGSDHRDESGCALAAMVSLGFVLFALLNVLVGLGVVGTTPGTIGFGAVVLALVAFGAGVPMTKYGRTPTRGVGIGLMIGWGVLTIASAGYCTGLNPGLYSLH